MHKNDIKDANNLVYIGMLN